MTSSPTKTLSVSLPRDLVDELDRISGREHRTRSDVLRDAVRRYIDLAGRQRTIPVEEASPDEIDAARRAEAEYARGECVRLEDLRRELGLTTR